MSDQERIAGLLQEHEELVQLYIHEDSTAWQLMLALFAADAGLIALANRLGAFDPLLPVTPLLIVVCVFAIVFNLMAYSVLQRSELHRLSRLFRAYSVEAHLTGLGCPIRTFHSAELNIFGGTMLSQPDVTRSALTDQNAAADDPTRGLKFSERIPSLPLRFIFILLAIAAVFLLVWVGTAR